MFSFKRMVSNPSDPQAPAIKKTLANLKAR